jgi:hypothetical protein
MISRTLLLLCSTGTLLLAAEPPAVPWGPDAAKNLLDQVTKQAIANALRFASGELPTFSLSATDNLASIDGRCAEPLLLAQIKGTSKFPIKKLDTGDGKFDAIAVKPMPVCEHP